MTVRTVYFECFPHYVGHLGHICGDRCLVFILCAGLLQAKCDKINLCILETIIVSYYYVTVDSPNSWLNLLSHYFFTLCSL